MSHEIINSFLAIPQKNAKIVLTKSSSNAKIEIQFISGEFRSSSSDLDGPSFIQIHQRTRVNSVHVDEHVIREEGFWSKNEIDKL